MEQPDAPTTDPHPVIPVISDPRLRWGAPCLGTTGVSVAEVIALRRAGVPDSRIVDALPDLTPTAVAEAVAWYERFGDDGLRPRPPAPGGRHPLVSIDARVQGGLPVVRGTRITVDAICGLHEAGRSAAQICAEYPGLAEADVAAALAYDEEAGR